MERLQGKAGSQRRVWKGCHGGFPGDEVGRQWNTEVSALSPCLSGPSVAVLLLEITLTYLIVVTFLVATTVIFQPTDFSHLKSKKGEWSHQGRAKLVHGEVILPKTSSLTFLNDNSCSDSLWWIPYECLGEASPAATALDTHPHPFSLCPPQHSAPWATPRRGPWSPWC